MARYYNKSTYIYLYYYVKQFYEFKLINNVF